LDDIEVPPIEGMLDHGLSFVMDDPLGHPAPACPRMRRNEMLGVRDRADRVALVAGVLAPRLANDVEGYLS